MGLYDKDVEDWLNQEPSDDDEHEHDDTPVTPAAQGGGSAEARAREIYDEHTAWGADETLRTGDDLVNRISSEYDDAANHGVFTNDSSTDRYADYADKLKDQLDEIHSNPALRDALDSVVKEKANEADLQIAQKVAEQPTYSRKEEAAQEYAAMTPDQQLAARNESALNEAYVSRESTYTGAPTGQPGLSQKMNEAPTPTPKHEPPDFER